MQFNSLDLYTPIPTPIRKPGQQVPWPQWVYQLPSNQIPSGKKVEKVVNDNTHLLTLLVGTAVAEGFYVDIKKKGFGHHRITFDITRNLKGDLQVMITLPESLRLSGDHSIVSIRFESPDWRYDEKEDFDGIQEKHVHDIARPEGVQQATRLYISLIRFKLSK